MHGASSPQGGMPRVGVLRRCASSCMARAVPLPASPPGRASRGASSAARAARPAHACGRRASASRRRGPRASAGRRSTTKRRGARTCTRGSSERPSARLHVAAASLRSRVCAPRGGGASVCAGACRPQRRIARSRTGANGAGRRTDGAPSWRRTRRRALDRTRSKDAHARTSARARMQGCPCRPVDAAAQLLSPPPATARPIGETAGAPFASARKRKLVSDMPACAPAPLTSCPRPRTRTPLPRLPWRAHARGHSHTSVNVRAGNACIETRAGTHCRPR